MDDRVLPAYRDVRVEPFADAVQLRQVPGHRLREDQLSLPSPDLPPEVPVRLPEAFQPDGPGVHRVQLHQRVDELLADPPPVCFVPAERRGKLVPDDDAVDPVHQIERSPDHPFVIACEDGARDANARPGQGREHAELPEHVVGGGQEGASGRAAEHALPRTGSQEERLVGVASLMALHLHGVVDLQPFLEISLKDHHVDQRLEVGTCHQARWPAAPRVDPRSMKALARLRAITIRWTSDGPS